ncbi:protein BatD [Lysobacter sp. TY2-98]|uniref:BatD family protein n=1 Tax=Lysobacter sp. TY2-98 TaxID=2290922 RepID=UPI000E2028DD|nr:BatD family protein [Lysobacter sp. TY2-98]AXK71143.1 protein BatD [Lysobacter sp. TY2-98]
MNRILHALFAIVLLALAGSVSAETRAWLDRDRIALGEATTLNVETDANAAPDYAPLLRDFDLSGQASQQQVQWVNGQLSRRSLYAVALRPRRDGLLGIPALRVGGQATAPLTLLVTQAPTSTAASGNADVFIESEADSQDPYVQQSVGWVVRLYSAIPLIAGQLDQPEPAGASLQRVGDDVQYRRTVGGRSYVVTERRFMLVPERSGELVVPPARFEGRGTGNALDQFFGDGQTALNAVARPRILHVRPIPANAPTPWLPLRGLTMRYVELPTTARVGAAANVVVEVEADGAGAAQLPDLRIGAAGSAQVFPERAQSDESMVDGRPHVREQRRFSIVPTREGRLVVPGPRIDWWDSRAGEARSTQLPPITLQVAPGAVAPHDAPSTTASPSGVPSGRAFDRRWVLIGIAGIAVALLVVGLAWRSASMRRRELAASASAEMSTGAVSPLSPGQPGTSSAPGANSPLEPQRPASSVATSGLPSLSRALELGDLADIEAVLRQLAGNDAPDLDAVAARLDDATQRDAVLHLRRARWGGGDPAEARARLRSAFATGPCWHTAQAPARDVLPPLYPRT